MLFNQYCFSLDVTEDLPEWHAMLSNGTPQRTRTKRKLETKTFAML